MQLLTPKLSKNIFCDEVDLAVEKPDKFSWIIFYFICSFFQWVLCPKSSIKVHWPIFWLFYKTSFKNRTHNSDAERARESEYFLVEHQYLYSENKEVKKWKSEKNGDRNEYDKNPVGWNCLLENNGDSRAKETRQEPNIFLNCLGFNFETLQKHTTF